MRTMISPTLHRPDSSLWVGLFASAPKGWSALTSTRFGPAALQPARWGQWTPSPGAFRLGCFMAVLAGAAGLGAQTLPPPVAAGKVTLQAISGSETSQATYDYEPPALSKYYEIKAEKLGVSRTAKTTTTKILTDIPAVPALAGETTLSFTFDADFEAHYEAAHPGVELIKPIGNWGQLWNAVARYDQITLTTTWDGAGQPTFELEAVATGTEAVSSLQGTGTGSTAMIKFDGAPGSWPAVIPQEEVAAAAGNIGFFQGYPPSAQYRFLQGTAYYFLKLQADGTQTVHHINYYTSGGVGDVREYYPVGQLTLAGVAGHPGSPAHQVAAYTSTTETLTVGGAYDGLKSDSAAQLFDDGKYALMADPTAHYAFATTGATASKLRYKLVIQPGLARAITWAETFTPDGQTEPTDYAFLSETETAAATETLPHILDPFEEGNLHRHGATPGNYQIITFDSALSADTNGNGIIMSPAGPITQPRIDGADTGALGANLSFRPNQNDNVDANDPTATTGGPDFANSRVDGADDLQSFVPVYLDIGQLLTQLPPANGFTYKLKQADSALNFVYTNLTQVTAFFHLTNPDTGFGPGLDQPARSATTVQITSGGTDIFEGSAGSGAFRDLSVLNKGAVILIEARRATDQPLVLEIIRGGTTVVEVGIPLSIYNPQLLVDVNRDGEIKTDGTDVSVPASPYRFWLNDDDDSGDAGGTADYSDPSSPAANYKDQVVNGTRDLIDFFPVFLDLKQLLTVLPPTTPGVTYKLKQAESALNFVYTNLTRDHALDYQTQLPTTGFSDTLDKAPGVAITHQITAAGVDLAQYCPSFLTGIRDSGWGVILIEGRATTTAPLVLSVEKDGTVIAEVKLDLRISNVEDMFRHVDMTQVPKKYDGSTYTLPAPVSATHTGDPGEAWPDSQTNGKYFVFLHGFNVDGQRARGWNSEVFKRLHVLGSKARFVGVSWHGATGIKLGGSYTDYHGAVFNAFQTGDALAGALSFTGSADVTLAAHSLGNIVGSQAIQSGGFVPTRYYMINCAVPIEAYDLPNVPDSQVHRMTESKWKSGAPGNRSTYAANWHQFFGATPSDHRNELKWKSRFGGIFDKSVVYDFHSPGDDVVEDPEWDSPSVLGLIFTQGFNFSRGAWVTQEFAKGANVGESLAVLNLSRVQGGWGESIFYTPPWGIGSLPPSPDQTREPYFGYFLEHDLFDVDPAKGSAKAGQKSVQYDLLARGIPALSFAVAVHPLERLKNLTNPSLSRNFDMEAQGRDAGVWPTEGHTADSQSAGRWLHSDFKNVSLPHVHKMYEEMINQGSLK
jgi:hypothetical protein